MPTNPWTLKTSRTAYENPWIRVDHQEVTTPAGTPGIYGRVHFKNHAIGIVPIDAEGFTYLVGQWRYVLNRYEWEIPEGGCPVGTDPLETAKRELREETGLLAKHWERVLDFDLSNSVTDESGTVFVARGLVQGVDAQEDTEDITVRRVPLSEAIQMTLNGQIRDALSILGLQRVALLRASGG